MGKIEITLRKNEQKHFLLHLAAVFSLILLLVTQAQPLTTLF